MQVLGELGEGGDSRRLEEAAAKERRAVSTGKANVATGSRDHPGSSARFCLHPKLKSLRPEGAAKYRPGVTKRQPRDAKTSLSSDTNFPSPSTR